MCAIALNGRANQVVRAMVADAQALGVTLHDVAGATVIDAGVHAHGSLTAGMMTARACMADLATLQWTTWPVEERTLPGVLVEVQQPLQACMASQYAGWQIRLDGYFAMGSGPMRAAFAGEKLFETTCQREASPGQVVGVLETASLPDEDVVRYVAEKCGVKLSAVTLIAARTASLAGGVQIVARSVETAMHKLHALDFDLSRVVAGLGEAPLPPCGGDDLVALGRTNDAVLYGSSVVLHVTGDDDSLASVIGQLPSRASRDFGQPFAEIFRHHGHDFYKIDPLLFSPASVTLVNLDTGRAHQAGQVEPALLAQSFFS